MKKQKIANYLKLGLFLFGISVLLWNCEKEDTFYSTTFKTPLSINAKTVSFEEAKSFFNKSKTALNYLAKGTNSIVASPDWNSISHHEIPYTDALLTKASVSINRKGEYTSELLFINVNGEMKNVIYTLWKEKVDANGLVINARVFFNKIDGTFIDAYKIENGKFTKRIVPVLKKNIQKATFLSFASFFQQEDYNDFWCWILENGGEYTFDDVDLGTVTSNLTDAGGSGGGSGDGGTMTYFDYVNGPSGDGLGGGSGGGGVSNTTSSTQITFGVSAILMNPPIDPDEEGKCLAGYVKNPTTGKCDPICNGGKIYNVVSGQCECPTGQVEDSNGNCVDKCETTVADLQKVFPNTNSTRLQEIADYINKHGKDFGLDTDEKLQHFLAQAAHEATNPINGIEFDTFEENLNYRWDKLGIKDYWDKYFNPITNPTADPNKEDPRNYKRSSSSNFVDVQKLANHVYNDAKRGKSKLGNTNLGDGYKYRGRGIFQLTGKYNYQQFTNFYQNNYNSTIDFTVNPGLIASDTEIAVISALWFFKTKVGTITANTTVTQITRKINGGLKGIKHRTSLFNKTKNHINCK